MALKLIGNIHQYIGVSSDDNPSDAESLIGSTIHHTDTGEMFIFDGDNWVEDLRPINAVSQGYDF